MILDDIGNLIRYPQVPHIDDVLRFLKRPDLLTLTSPEIEITGRDLFVRIMRYAPKPADQNKFEIHRIHADIQVLLKGREIMQYVPAWDLQSLTEYDSVNDYQFFKADKNVSELMVCEKQFAIFLPGEPHRPSCQPDDYIGENLKLVFKVKMQ